MPWYTCFSSETTFSQVVKFNSVCRPYCSMFILFKNHKDFFVRVVQYLNMGVRLHSKWVEVFKMFLESHLIVSCV